MLKIGTGHAYKRGADGRQALDCAIACLQLWLKARSGGSLKSALERLSLGADHSRDAQSELAVIGHQHRGGGSVTGRVDEEDGTLAGGHIRECTSRAPSSTAPDADPALPGPPRAWSQPRLWPARSGPARHLYRDESDAAESSGGRQAIGLAILPPRSAEPRIVNSFRPRPATEWVRPTRRSVHVCLHGSRGAAPGCARAAPNAHTESERGPPFAAGPVTAQAALCSRVRRHRGAAPARVHLGLRSQELGHLEGRLRGAPLQLLGGNRVTEGGFGGGWLHALVRLIERLLPVLIHLDPVVHEAALDHVLNVGCLPALRRTNPGHRLFDQLSHVVDSQAYPIIRFSSTGRCTLLRPKVKSGSSSEGRRSLWRSLPVAAGSIFR
eukprot:scaffold2585_cov368-Prasinococcus_capsulatus_cf.AAC.9